MNKVKSTKKLSQEELDILLDGPGMEEWRKQCQAIREKHERGEYVEVTNAKQFRGMHLNKIIDTLGKKRRWSKSPEEKAKTEARKKQEHEWAESRGTAIVDEKEKKDD